MKRILITLYVLASVVLTAVAQARFTSNTEMYSFGQIEWEASRDCAIYHHQYG